MGGLAKQCSRAWGDQRPRPGHLCGMRRRAASSPLCPLTPFNAASQAQFAEHPFRVNELRLSAFFKRHEGGAPEGAET